MRITLFPSGEAVPVLGQGSWGMAETPGERRSCPAADPVDHRRDDDGCAAGLRPPA